MPQTNRRVCESVVQLRDNQTGLPTIWGYAAVFYDPADPGTRYRIWRDLEERIMPTAFNRALRECDPLALFNHEKSAVLGRLSSNTLRLSVDARGLRYEITTPDTATGREVVELVRRGDVRGSSFSFVPKVTKERKLDAPVDGVRWIVEIEDCDLYDVGPVTIPAYTGTEAGVRLAGVDGEAVRNGVVQRLQAAAHWDSLRVELVLAEQGG